MIEAMDETKHVKDGRKGGITKWARVPKKNRSAIMRKVSLARWNKAKIKA
jgi:hypothetical protein